METTLSTKSNKVPTQELVRPLRISSKKIHKEKSIIKKKFAHCTVHFCLVLYTVHRVCIWQVEFGVEGGGGGGGD